MPTWFDPSVIAAEKSIDLVTEREEFVVATTAIREQLAWPEARGLFSPHELKRIDQKKRSKEKAATATGLWLAKVLTGSEIQHESNGQPRPTNSAFSISISNKIDLVAVAVAPKAYRIGVDLESFDAVDDLEVFQKYALTAKERRNLKEDPRRETTVLWSLKESYLKASHADLEPTRIQFSGVETLQVEVLATGTWQRVEKAVIERKFLGGSILTVVCLS